MKIDPHEQTISLKIILTLTGILNNLFSSDFFKITSKISYSILLTHTLVTRIFVLNSNTAIFISAELIVSIHLAIWANLLKFLREDHKLLTSVTLNPAHSKFLSPCWVIKANNINLVSPSPRHLCLWLFLLLQFNGLLFAGRGIFRVRSNFIWFRTNILRYFWSTCLGYIDHHLR